jgi:galactokinase
MGKSITNLTVSSPGRICLFGEHQDYLQLPVISCAISLRLSIEGTRRSDNVVHISLPDIGSEVSFSLDETMPYRTDRDYFRSAINVLRRHGISISTGIECTVEGKIPIRAGTSSSSALVVSWVNLLAQMSDKQREISPEESARYAHEAEVLEFNESGGMMDQCAAAYGGVLFLNFFPSLSVERLHAQLDAFVLGDSGEPKDTQNILSRLKNRVSRIRDHLSRSDPEFSLHTAKTGELKKFKSDLENEAFLLLEGTIRNREITHEAHDLLLQPGFDERAFGRMLTEHQDILRDVLQISTPKIDRMIDAAMSAGAYGGKINGSGGGGCMFVYAPKNQEMVAQAIERAGGKSYIVRCDDGTRIESEQRAV